MKLSNEEMIFLLKALNEYWRFCKWTFYKSNAPQSMKAEASRGIEEAELLSDRIMKELSKNGCYLMEDYLKKWN